MEEDSENGNESSHSAHANGMNEVLLQSTFPVSPVCLNILLVVL
jgi:hypothetical protein